MRLTTKPQCCLSPILGEVRRLNLEISSIEGYLGLMGLGEANSVQSPNLFRAGDVRLLFKGADVPSKWKDNTLFCMLGTLKDK